MARRIPLALTALSLAWTLAACGGPISAEPDAGGTDPGVDAGRDAGPIDAGHDAGPVDAGTDAGTDAGPDGGPPPKTTVDWCRLQYPLDTTTTVAEPLTVFGRVYVADLTDRSDGVDGASNLVAQAGYGPRSSTPGAAWSWTAASPNPSWNAADAGEPGNDEWATYLDVSSAGSFDFAFRFSYDGGETWTYCDRNAGPGSDGSEDGYQTANAGHVEVTAPSCDPNPCTNPPAATCADGSTRRVPADPGTCSLTGGEAACEYPTTDEPCAQDEQCVNGACAVVPPDLVGWCRLQFPSSATVPPGDAFDVYGRVYLQGLTDISQGGNDTDPSLVGAVGIGPRGSDPETAGGWTWTEAAANPQADLSAEPNNDEYFASPTVPTTLGSYDFAFRFSKDGGAHWRYCDLAAGAGSDGSEDGYQPANAGKLEVADPCDPNPCDQPPPDTCTDATTRSVAANPGTCTVTAGRAECDYPVSDVACAQGETCSGGVCAATPPNYADWCRLEGTAPVELWLGGEFPAAGHVNEAGITDRTAGTDVDPSLVAEGGIGGRGTDPSTDGSWTWMPASAEPLWDDAAEPGNDSYVALVTPPNVAGDYDFAFRFSVDGGTHWLYCDQNAGPGHDGSEDGYQPANAGHVLVSADPCRPNPCTVPPPPYCNGDVLTVPAVTGICTPNGSVYTCDYSTDATETDCTLSSLVCDSGACVSPYSVGWCLFQWNPDLTATAGTSADFYGRVYVAGLTDQSAGVDTSSLLQGQLGYGPDGSDPATAGWTWSAVADPTPGWDGGSSNNDEYVATITLPSAGTYDTAWRFSADGGSTWTYCDADGVTPSDPYSTAAAGNLVTTP